MTHQESKLEIALLLNTTNNIEPYRNAFILHIKALFNGLNEISSLILMGGVIERQGQCWQFR